MEKTEIIDVVKAKKLGTPGSIYVLIPSALCNRLQINENTEFVVYLDDQNNIILKRKEA